MNRRLLTSAVAIHATACVVAFLAAGPGEAGANAREGNGSANSHFDTRSNTTESVEDSLFHSDLSEEEWAKSLPVLETPVLPDPDHVDVESASALPVYKH